MAERKEAIYARAGLDHRLGFGTAPALLVVDLQVGFTNPMRSPLAGDLSAQVDAVNRLLEAAHRTDVPVVFTAIGYDPERQADGGLWVEKSPTLRNLVRGGPLVEIDDRLDRLSEDLVIVKQYASAFFGTPLASTLTRLGIDTLVVTGCTTSGCVRASVVDAISLGFRPIVPVEAVGDRAREPHDANLFDIDSKYGDVLPLSEVLAYLDER